MNKRLLLVLLAFAPACVFTDLAELPPPIAVVNNSEPDASEDASSDMGDADMPEEVCELAPTPLTTDTITHFAADRFDNVIFYAARLTTGGIRLGRIEGDSLSTSFATTTLPGMGVDSISVAAVSQDRMLFAVLRDDNRLVDVYTCTAERCTSFGTTGLTEIEEIQLVAGDPPLLGFVRGLPPNQEFVARQIDLDQNAIELGNVLSATLLTGVEGVSFAGASNNNYRVAFGSPLSGFYTGTGTGMLGPQRCLTFEKRLMDTYFTRVKRLSESLLVRADGLFLTNCTGSLQLTARLPRDADFVPLTGMLALAVWPEAVSGVERVRGALIENGAIARTVDLGVWENVAHVRTFRTQTELMVFWGGEGTHLQLLRASPGDLVTCFRND